MTPQKDGDAPSRPTKTVHIPVDLHDELKDRATERGISPGVLAERLMRDALPRLVPVDELVLLRPAGPGSGGAKPGPSSTAP